MKLLLPIDGSKCSERTMEWAAETFDKTRALYYILVAIPVLPDVNTVEYDVEDTLVILNKAKAELERRGCNVVKAEYVLGDPVESICRYADEVDADQVVMGSHGRTGLMKLLMGSVSIAVLERCKKNVAIYRNVKQPPKTLAETDIHP